MVFFRVLIKKILYKIPLKTLLLLGIFLMLAFFIFGSDVFASNYDIEYSYNGTNYSVRAYDENNGYVIICNPDGTPYRNYFISGNGTRYNPWKYAPGVDNRNGTFNQIGNSNFFGTFSKNAQGVYTMSYSGYHTGALSIPSRWFCFV